MTIVPLTPLLFSPIVGNNCKAVSIVSSLTFLKPVQRSWGFYVGFLFFPKEVARLASGERSAMDRWTMR